MMATAMIEIKNDLAYGFLQQLERLNVLRIVSSDNAQSTIEAETSTLNNIRAGLDEVNLFKKGKLKTTPAKSFLDEL